MIWQRMKSALIASRKVGLAVAGATCILFAAAMPIQHVAAQQPAAVATGLEGLWLDHTGRGAIEIAQCAQSLCGRIVWMKDPNDKQGRPLVDALNEDKKLRLRPVCGLQIIGDLKLQRDGSWDNGWIYDPEQGESFDVELRLRAPDKLQVKGYKGLKFLSETFQWTRTISMPGPRCAA